VVHCCAADVPIGLLRGAGARAVSVDVAVLAAAAYDEVGELLDAGGRLFAGVVDATEPTTDPAVTAVVDRLRRLLDMLGYEAGEVEDRLVLTPTCGLAGADPAYVRRALALLRESARALSDADRPD
jgi:methionine synthase II (cobalamin-independent)